MGAVSGQAELAVAISGPTDATPVLLLHAGVTDRRSWHHVIDHLAPWYRCISYDARGYGETIYTPEDDWSPVGDAIAVLDAAGCDRVCVVAASMGGAVALELVLTHPERVSGLVLIGSAASGAPDAGPEPEATRALIEALERIEETEDLPEANRLEAWLWLDGPEAPEGRVAGAARELFLEMNGRALAAVDPGRPEPTAPTWPRLDQITVPTTVMVGDLDLLELQAISRGLAATIPGARQVQLSNVAHLPHLEGDVGTLDAIVTAVRAGAGSDRATS